MKRQVLLLLSAVVLAPACVLEVEVLDGAADEYGESDESSSDAESSSSTDDQSEESTSSSSTDAESSSTDDQSEESTSSSTTDAESSTDDQSEESTSSSTTDAESSTDDQSEESTSSSTTDAESSSSEEDADDQWIDCGGMQDEYEEIVAMTDCSEDSDCKIIGGHCHVGIGGCYYAVNQSVDETELDELADEYSNGGCAQGICDCPESPEFAICDEGTCVPGN